MSAPPPTLRVVLVEDQPLFREMLQHLLGSMPGFEVRAAADVATAAGWDATQMDVAILDFDLPDGTGLDLGRRLQAQNPRIGIILLSAVDRVSALLDLDEPERWSYLSKNSATSTKSLVHAVRAAAAGRFVIDPHLISKRQRRSGGRLDALSTRQYEVLALISEGLTNQAIAERLGLAVNSVNNHVNAIYAALELADLTRNPRVTAVRIFLEDSV